jgi:hypothetical protein
MADNHFEWNENSNPGANLKEACKTLELAWNKVSRQRGILIQSKDQGESGDDEFVTIASRYGFSDKVEAAAFFAELDSMFAADAAVSQFLNRCL